MAMLKSSQVLATIRGKTLNKNRLQQTLPAIKLGKGLRKYLCALQVEMEN